MHQMLPLHQRLRLIQSSHGCTLREARRILWAGEETSGADPWAQSAAATSASDKENLLAQDGAADATDDSSAACDVSDASGADKSAGGEAVDRAALLPSSMSVRGGANSQQGRQRGSQVAVSGRISRIISGVSDTARITPLRLARVELHPRRPHPMPALETIRKVARALRVCRG